MGKQLAVRQIAAPWLIVLMPWVWYKARTLDALNLGDQLALGLGVPLNWERLGLVAAAVGLASSCVAVSGGIGFVGLIGPHLARRLTSGSHKVLLPASALLGSLLVLAADMVTRMLPADIPTGIMVALIGAPYFFYLLLRTKV